MPVTQYQTKQVVTEPLPYTINAYTSKDSVARHDKNIANNVSDFLVYGPRAVLCMNLAMYFQYIFGRTLPNRFGYYEFDFKDFCKLFEWTDSLQRTVRDKEELYITDNKEQVFNAFNIDSDIDDKDYLVNKENLLRFAQTKIGDAFVRLRFQGIIYSNKSKYTDGNEIVAYSGQSVFFLKEFIAAYTVIRGRASRLTIEYKPNVQSVYNSVLNFTYTNCKQLGELRKNKSLDFLHLYLSYVLNTLKTRPDDAFDNRWSITRKKFAKVVFLDPNREYSDLNRAILRKCRAYRDLKNIEPVEFSISRQENSVLIVFPELKPATAEQKKKARSFAYKRFFQQKLYDYYAEVHCNVNSTPLSFKEWLNSPTVDVDQKKMAYVISQKLIYKNMNVSIDSLKERDLNAIGIGDLTQQPQLSVVGSKIKPKGKRYPGAVFPIEDVVRARKSKN